MKFIKFILIAICFLLAGYLIGNFFPVKFLQFSQPEEEIASESELEVKILRDDGIPISNLEVDVDSKVPPSITSMLIAETDENGVAKFQLKPGKYFIFFNALNFPEDLENPFPKQIEVKKEIINETVIILNKKQ